MRRAEPEYKLFKSYEYAVQISGLVGENYVAISGKARPSAEVYQPNDESVLIPTEAAGGILAATQSASELADSLKVTIQKVNTTLDAINQGVLNNPNQRKLAEALDGVAKLTTSASQTFDQNTGRQLQQTLGNAQRASANIERATRDAGGLSREASGLTRDARVLVRDARGQINTTSGNLNSVLNENRGPTAPAFGQHYARLQLGRRIDRNARFYAARGRFSRRTRRPRSLRWRAPRDNIAVATHRHPHAERRPHDQRRSQAHLGRATRIDRIAARHRRLAQGLCRRATEPANCKGVLASLGTTAIHTLEITTASLNEIIADPAVQADIKGSADNLNGTLAATRATAERINAILGGKKRTQTDSATGQGATDKAALSNQFGSPGASLDVAAFGRDAPRRVDGRNFGDVQFDADLLGGPFRIGVSSIGEGDDFTLAKRQLPQQKYRRALRFVSLEVGRGIGSAARSSSSPRATRGG